MKKINLNENNVNEEVTSFKHNIIKEERGVGSSREWLDAVKIIVDYVASYVKYRMKGFDNEWHVTIPEELTVPFKNIFDKLVIRVDVEDLGDKAEHYSGSGSVPSYNLPRINLNKKEDNRFVYSVPIEIDLKAFSNGNELVRKTLAGNFVHELNHKIDEYYRTAQSKEIEGNVYAQTCSYLELKDKLGEGNVYYKLVYFLFSESEQNANAASVYTDLEAIGSVRKNFKEDIKKIKAYWICSSCKNCINYIEQNEITDQTYLTLVSVFKSNPILSPLPKVDMFKISPERLQKAFLNKAKKELSNYYRAIGRVASYYYDMSEKSETEIKTP